MKTQVIRKLSGTLAAGEVIGTNIGQIHILSDLGNGWYGTNIGDLRIVAP